VTHALRPLSVGELLDRTFFFYRRHFLLFVGIAVLPSIIMLAFALSTALFGPGAGVLFSITSALALVFVYLVTTALAQGATVVAVSQILLERDTNVAQAFSHIWSRIGELLVLILNMGVRIMLAAIFFIVPGVVLALMYALAVPVAVLEGKGISESLSRSAQLTKGHRWRILLVYVLLTVLTGIVTMLWYAPVTIAVVLTAGPMTNGQVPLWAQVALQFGQFVTRSVLGPIMTIAIALVYYDVRVRKEAFDLEHMMQQIDQSGLAPSPTT
jgi:hypothetical protein